MLRICLLLFGMVLVCRALETRETTNLATDKSSLAALRSYVTFDPNNILADEWSDSSSVCNWTGVTCDDGLRRVVALNLSFSGLVGTVPPHLGNLSSLVVLSFGNNSFLGALPGELSRLSRLKTMDFGYNALTGSVPPWLGSLSELENLLLVGNRFSGSVPTTISSLTSLQIIDIGFNQLSGPVPSFLFNMSSLRVVAMLENRFSNGLPGNICQNLPFVQKIFFSGNWLSGPLPSKLWECKELRVLSLSSNHFSGKIPRHIGNLTNLKELYLGFNQLTEIPQEINNLQQLEILDVRNNSLKGPVPLHLFNMSSLKALVMAGNGFNENLPDNICQNLPSIQNLDFYQNRLSGPLPSKLWQCQELDFLALGFNEFSGEIPRTIGNLTELRKLYLGSNKLTGFIPEEIGNLPLEHMELYENALIGSVPLTVFNMSSLTTLGLSQNSLNGSLPENLCRNLPRIQRIFLARNRLSGPIPSSLSECREVLELSLGFNSLQGRIPRAIGNLTRATYIVLNENKLTGSIPEEIGNLRHVLNVDLSDNNLTRTIPLSLFNVNTIEVIGLGSNQLSGNLPPNLGLWAPNLKGLYLGANQLSGPLPRSISNASQLTHLDITSNHFYGFVPDIRTLKNLQLLSLSNNDLTLENEGVFSAVPSLRNLRVFDLSFNPLNSTLPASIGSNFSSSLVKLHLSRCDLRGDIPASLGNLSSLIHLSLAENRLSGSIPTSIGKCRKVQGLLLNENILIRPIPSELCQLQNLYVLNLGKNMLSGQIPSCLRNTTNSLRLLYLDTNELTSSIPPEFWELEYILTLDLSSNSLVGSLSTDVGKLKVAALISFANNQLSGDITSSLGGIKALSVLSLANNMFGGSIPDSLGNLRSLEFLDFSNNRLTGEIPKSLEKLLLLKFINLSFNELYGPIPSDGPFPNFSSRSFMRNYALCGAPRLGVPPCKRESSGTRKALVLRYVVPGICLLVAIMILVFLIMIFCRKRKAKQESIVALVPLNPLRRVTRLVLFEATNGFNEENLLGSGSFGSVYKGTLSDGLVVAIKVFNLELEEAFTSFDKECDVLCNIRHRNLVRVITCCSSPDFKALVLEYMPKGSLEKWLYSDGVFLNILQRLNITIDVASALEYLHYGYSMPVVHCDLKPSNVLLDEDMVAHVADFGIAKLLCGEDSVTRTMTLATIGYMAPEYGSSGIVSRKGDVYSFGIMLMEIFTRKKPVDEMFSSEMSLKQWVENSAPHSISKVIDVDLLRPEDRQYSIKKDCVSSLMELALACSASSPEQRIDMNKVTSTLRKIKKKFFRS